MSVATAPPAAAAVACTFNGQSQFVPNISPGSSVAVDCTGLTGGQLVALVEASPLAGVVPAASQQAYADISHVQLASADGTGHLVATWTVPNPFTPGTADPNAQCPPTQAQVNAGLPTCVVTVADVATQTPLTIAGLVYTNNPTPTVSPNIALSPTSGGIGASIGVSDTPPGFWGAGASGSPGTLQGVSVPAPTVLVGGTPATTSSVAISAASYDVGTMVLTPPTATGSFQVPAGTPCGDTTVQVLEPNVTPFAGNGPNNTVADSAAFTNNDPVQCPVDQAPVTSNTTATIDRNVSNTATVTLPATDTDATPVASCSLVGTPSDSRLSVSIGSPTSGGCPATLTDNGSASVGATVTFQFNATDTANLTGNTSTVTVTITPTAVVDGALDVIVNGPVASTKASKNFVGKVTNMGNSTLNVSDSQISVVATVNGQVVGQVTGTGASATLGPGASKRFKLTWTYGAGALATGDNVEFAGTLNVPGDANPGNNLDTESRTAK